MTVDRENGPSDVVDAPAEDELAARLTELESAITELRDRTVRPPRGPLGLPRPPTPREFMEYTDKYAIPATIAFLQANIRALQAFQAALKMLRGADRTRDRTADARERTMQLGTKTLDALDAALDDLKDAYREGALPDDSEARTILTEAQRLTDDIREELRLTAEPHQIDLQTGKRRTRGAMTSDPRVDPTEVESELDMLRERYETTPIDVEGPDDEDDGTDESSDTDERTGTDQAGGAGETDSVNGRRERRDDTVGADSDDDRDEAGVPDEFFEEDEDGTGGGENGPEYGER